jgi:hypothetical protein
MMAPFRGSGDSHLIPNMPCANDVNRGVAPSAHAAAWRAWAGNRGLTPGTGG